MSTAPEVLSSYTNSEGEHVSIERVTAGPFQGQRLLVIHDDPPLSARAPMLLDDGVVEWLTDALSESEGALREIAARYLRGWRAVDVDGARWSWVREVDTEPATDAEARALTAVRSCS